MILRKKNKKNLLYFLHKFLCKTIGVPIRNNKNQTETEKTRQQRKEQLGNPFYV